MWRPERRTFRLTTLTCIRSSVAGRTRGVGSTEVRTGAIYMATKLPKGPLGAIRLKNTHNMTPHQSCEQLCSHRGSAQQHRPHTTPRDIPTLTRNSQNPVLSGRHGPSIRVGAAPRPTAIHHPHGELHGAKQVLSQLVSMQASAATCTAEQRRRVGAAESTCTDEGVRRSGPPRACRRAQIGARILRLSGMRTRVKGGANWV